LKYLALLFALVVTSASSQEMMKPDPACEGFSETLGCMHSKYHTGPNGGMTRIDSDAAGIIDSEVDKVMVPPTAAEAADIFTWIPHACCRTSTCCRKVKETDLDPVDRMKMRVNETGQIKEVNRWSRDGNVWRCACDYDDKKSKWIVHPKANTRCIFPVPMGM
jgi:hypothetical protein